MKRILYILTALCIASSAWADEITDVSITPGSNISDDWGMKENIAPSDVNNNYREFLSIVRRWYQDWRGAVVAYGSADAVRITPSRTISTLEDGLMFAFEATASNTGATTFEVSSLGAKDLRKANDTALAAGDLEAGQKVWVVYNADQDRFQMLSQSAIATLSDPMTTRGDFVFRDATNTTVRLALGSTDQVIKSDGQDASWGTSPAAGQHTIWLPANALIARSSTGASSAQIETATNRVNVPVKDFDASTSEFVQAQIAMPKSLDESTGIIAQFLWTVSSDANGSVVWAAECLSLGDNDTIEAAFGTAITVADTSLAITDVHISAQTASITCAGTPAEDDIVLIQVYRDTADSGDTEDDDARLLGVRIIYTSDAPNDL